MSDLIDEVRARQKILNPRAAKAIREAAGVSRARMAQQLGVHEHTVMRWERGERRPRKQTLVAYAALLDQLRREVEA